MVWVAMRKVALLEPLLMFAFIIAYIWKLRFLCFYLWIAIPALMILSHVLHRESPRWLGFELRGFATGLKNIAPPLIALTVLMFGGGMIFHTIRPIGLTGALLALAPYLPWGVVQQYALNGYFLNRLNSGILASVLFCAAHAPNPFLMAVTLPLAWVATQLYRRNRNLFVLGIAHAVIGWMLFLVAPDSISHHLRVGPAYRRFALITIGVPSKLNFSRRRLIR